MSTPSLINPKLVILCSVWYFTSVISSSTTKEILRDFTYPITLTELQFIINALLCLLLLISIQLINSRYNFDILSKFPNGTFPPQLNQRINYSIRKDFLNPTSTIIKTTLPMGMFQFIGQIASHNSTSLIPVSLVHTIKALSPITTVLIYRFLFSKKFHIKTYITLIPLCVGVMLCCRKNDNLDISNSLFFKGTLFAFISMLIFVSQNIFAKKILTWEDKENNDKITNFNSVNDEDDDDTRAKAFLNRFNWKITRPESASLTPILPLSASSASLNELNSQQPYFNFSSKSLNELSNPERYSIKKPISRQLDKLSVLFYCSVVGFILTLPFYILSEFNNNSFSINSLSTKTIYLILIYGFSHFIQSLTAFQILGMVSPVNYSIANILKRIIIISCSIAIERTHLNFQQWFGLSLTFLGLYSYDKWGVQR